MVVVTIGANYNKYDYFAHSNWVKYNGIRALVICLSYLVNSLCNVYVAGNMRKQTEGCAHAGANDTHTY